MDAIQNAVTERVMKETLATVEVIDRMRAALTEYEKVVSTLIETRVANAVLASLGAEVKPLPDTSTAEHQVKNAWKEVEGVMCPKAPEAAKPSIEFVRPAEIVQLVEPITQVVTSAPKVVPEVIKIPPKVDPQVHAEFKRLSSEVTELSAAVSAGQVSSEIAFQWIAALIAETRIVLGQIPESHPLAEPAGKLVSRLSGIRKDANIHDYIVGLAFGATGDWPKISRDSRRRLEALRQPKAEKKTEKKADAAAASIGAALDWPALPSLRKVIAERVMLVISGKSAPEKAELCQKRFGIVGEWVEVEDAPRTVDAVCQRIRSGRVGAVVMLEGFLPHKTYDRIVEACKAKGVAFALADRGGIGSFDAAFKALDERTAA